MKPIRVIPVGAVARPLLRAVATVLQQVYRVPCSVLTVPLDPARALHPERRQVHSTELLVDLAALGLGSRVLGVTALDLYIPILTFVFGEAQLGGDCAVVSYHRLQQQLYGEAPDDDLMEARLIKGAIHEIGHTYGLVHCDDHECVMAAAYSVEWVDLKSETLCDDCRRGIFQQQ